MSYMSLTSFLNSGGQVKFSVYCLVSCKLHKPIVIAGVHHHSEKLVQKGVFIWLCQMYKYSAMSSWNRM